MPLHPYVLARKHLHKTEPIFRPIIKELGTCTLEPNPDGFDVLVRSIISQQISGKAAESISGRLEKLCGRSGFKPKKLASLTDEQIRSCGVSGGKLASLRSLSQHFLEDPKLRGSLDKLSDEEIHDHLIPIRGIGPWTVQMFLIFSLGRLDVWPVLDLGLRSGVQRHFAMVEMPKADELIRMAEPWRPYRTVATWYFWRSKGPVPQSE